MSAEIETPVILENKFPLKLASILLVGSGLSLLVWASLSGVFRDDQNVLTGRFCLPLAIGVAFVIFGSLVGTRWQTFAAWTALALTGQAASLQMINAGRLIHFQHYRAFPDLFSNDFFSLGLLALQIVLVAVGIGQRWASIKHWLEKNFAIWQIVLILLFVAFAGAAVTPDVSIYTMSLLMSATAQIVSLANIILLAWAVPSDSMASLRQKLDGFVGEKRTDKPVLDRFSALAALWIVLLTGTLSFFVYQNHPHVPDETQYLFQAKYMAAGQVTVTAPPVPEAFAMYMTPYRAERWYGIFSPGWPTLLAIGIMFNAEWLVNPLLAGLCGLLAYLFFQEIYSRRVARIAILLLCCSPWFIFMSMSFMSHVFLLTCALGAAVLLSSAIRSNRFILALSAGLLVGIAALIRPLDGVMIAAWLGVWTLIKCQSWSQRIWTGAALVAGTVITTALVFPYNKAVTGNALLSPLDAYYTQYFSSDVMALGFGAGRGFHWGLDAFPGHSPLEAVINGALNVFLLNTELFGWATGSLLLATGFVVSGSVRRKDYWTFAVILVVIGGYSLFWYHGGPDFGARYWFLCIIPLIALTVRGMEWISEKIESQETIDPRVILAVGILCALTLISYVPWRSLDKYYHYLQMSPDIARLAEVNNFGKSLVLIRGEEHPDYQSAWIYNSVNFEGEGPIYAWDKSSEVRKELLREYQGRPVWIVDGPTRTNGSYQIIRGPIAAEELLREPNR